MRTALRFSLLVCLLGLSTLYGQAHWQLGLDYAQGITLRHRSTMVFPLDNPARTISVELMRQTGGKRYWEHAMKHPRWGVSALWLTYGNQQDLGYALSIHPFFELPIFRWGPVTAWGRMAAGPTYITRKFDRQTNAINNAIGSHGNVFIAFGAHLEWKMSDRLILRGGGVLSHQSNAKRFLPNLGLNSAKLRTALIYNLTTEDVQPYSAKRKIEFDKSWVFYGRVGLGQVENKVPDGPSYQVWIAQVYAAHFVGPTSKFFGGFELSYDESVAAFALDQDFPDNFPSAVALRPAVLAGYELGAGQIGMMGQVFLYLHERPGASTRNFWGMKFGPNIYLHSQKKNKRFNPYIGIYVKVHYFIADLYETTIGVAF